MLFSSLQKGLLLMKCLQSAVRLSSKGSVVLQAWFPCLHPRRALLAPCARLAWAMLCPPCASAFLAGRSSERGWWLLHVLILGHCELRAGLIFLLGHQHVTWGSGELGQGELASRAPAGCSALNFSSSATLRAVRCGSQACVLFWKVQIWWELYLASRRWLPLLLPALRGETVIHTVWRIARLRSIKMQDPGRCSVQGIQNPSGCPLRPDESPHGPSHQLVCSVTIA